MALLFRLSKDGRRVHISNIPSKENFDKHSEVMDVDEFVMHLPNSQKEKILAVSSELIKLHDKRIGEIEVVFDVFISQYNSMNIYYWIAGNDYTYVEGGDYGCGGVSYKQIVQYCKGYFGEKFIEEHEDVLHKEGNHYYEDGREISKTRFLELQKKIEMCTQIVTMNKDIEKEFRRSLKNKEKEVKKSGIKKH